MLSLSIMKIYPKTSKTHHLIVANVKLRAHKKPRYSVASLVSIGLGVMLYFTLLIKNQVVGAKFLLQALKTRYHYI